MGNGRSLPSEVLDRLIPGLQAMPTTLIFLAYCNGQAVGIATCFIGFSTFAARPLINIHDLGVVPEYRGRGIGSALLRAVEQHALEMGCAKITLEVQENNHRARRVYSGAGFAQSTLQSVQGGALFFTKILT
ncbi:MAG: GNAT family N-acetyltransferase [Pirellulaceae bacterium]|nr:GNAT family N-acetyltransferase [Pirellulaceae bacterium]